MKVTNDFIVNNFGKNLALEMRSEAVDANRQVEIYLDRLYERICAKVMQDDVRVQSLDDIRSRLDTEEKVELFKKAQAWQAIYESSNAINGLVLDEHSMSYNDWNRDTLRILRHILGFNRPTMFTQR